jgi:hypothetical protein
MKIAITIDLNGIYENNIFSNGHSFNVLLWYDIFKKCGYEVIFIYNNKEKEKNIDKYKEKYKFIYLDDFLSDIKKYKIDVLITLGYSLSINQIKLIKNNNIKNILIDLGSQYYNDTLYLLNPKYKNHNNLIVSSDENLYDEVWISPHFKYSIEYLKVRIKTDNIYVCPYIWREDLIKDYKDKILEGWDNLKIAICEPNINQNKNCIIPFSICEKANHLIKSCNIWCLNNVNENKFMKNYILNSKLQKNNKITVNGRYPIPYILSEHCNCILSFVENWDLNYIYLECFYLGVPIIHNSPMLKDYGYYYPDFDINKAIEQIEKVKKNHNKEKYIEKHKDILHKYSIDNPMTISWIKGKLNGEINFNFE